MDRTAFVASGTLIEIKNFFHLALERRSLYLLDPDLDAVLCIFFTRHIS
jgi:hypothetical protein